MAARKDAEAADEAGAKAARAGNGGALAGFPMSAAARAGVIVAILAVLAAVWLSR